MPAIAGKMASRQLPAKPGKALGRLGRFRQSPPVAAGQRRCAFRLDSVRFKPVKDALLD